MQRWLLLIGFLVLMNTAWQAAVSVLAAVALSTGLVRYCPANALFKHMIAANPARKHLVNHVISRHFEYYMPE